MALELVDQPEGTKVTVNGPKATVTIQGDTPASVGNTEAKQMALNAARPFLSKPGISSVSGPYPVDADGNQLEDPTKPRPEGFRFRQDFTIQEGM
jgi:hypothetical protein